MIDLFIVAVVLIAMGILLFLTLTKSENKQTEQKEPSADNVHPAVDVPESSYLNSKYWEKYGGNYRLPLTAHHFLEEYLKTHTEFKIYDAFQLYDMKNDKDARDVKFYQQISIKGFVKEFPVLSWAMRPCETGLITVCYVNVFNIQKPTKEYIYNYVDYYKKHKNPIPYGFDNVHNYYKEIPTNQIWIEDLSDLDKVIEVVRPYAKQQKEELLKYASVFDELEKVKYTEIMENYKKQIADLNKMRNDFTDKTVDTILKQINLKGDF